MKPYVNLIADVLGIKPKELDATCFIGAVIDPFEFSILLKEDGSVWEGTGSVEIHKGSKKSDYWDNTDWLCRVRDGDKEALKLIPKTFTPKQIEDFLDLLNLVTEKGWLN